MREAQVKYHFLILHVMEAEELQENLRLFAMRKAAAASKEFTDLKSRVVVSVQSEPSRNCPMHGRHGHYQVPSRKEMARELRLSAAKEAREARERSLEHGSSPRRGSASSQQLRSQSLEPNFFNSMPRRMSSTPASASNKLINRHGSFQEPSGSLGGLPIKKDVFAPKVDFKNSLRQFNPKDSERSRGQQMTSRSRHDSEPMDYHDSNSYFTQQLTAHNPYAVNPKRGTFMTSNNSLDLDNGSSGPASLPIMTSNFNKSNKLRLEISSRSTTPLNFRSPAASRPQSPRRVEFADEVFFNFNGGGHHLYQRSASSDIQPSQKAKPILRNVNSDAGSASKRPNSLIEQFEMQQQSLSLPEPLSPLVIEHTNLDTSVASASASTQSRKMSNEDSLVQIYIPHQQAESEDDDETLSAASEQDLEEKEQQPRSSKNEVKRTMSAEVTPTAKRVVPPMLGDWNRSQSFPPPKATSAEAVARGENGLKQKDDVLDDGNFVSERLILHSRGFCACVFHYFD